MCARYVLCVISRVLKFPSRVWQTRTTRASHWLIHPWHTESQQIQNWLCLVASVANDVLSHRVVVSWNFAVENIVIADGDRSRELWMVYSMVGLSLVASQVQHRVVSHVAYSTSFFIGTAAFLQLYGSKGNNYANHSVGYFFN